MRMLLDYADMDSTITNLKGQAAHLDGFRKGCANPKSRL